MRTRGCSGARWCSRSAVAPRAPRPRRCRTPPRPRVGVAGRRARGRGPGARRMARHGDGRASWGRRRSARNASSGAGWRRLDRARHEPSARAAGPREPRRAATKCGCGRKTTRSDAVEPRAPRRARTRPLATCAAAGSADRACRATRRPSMRGLGESLRDAGEHPLGAAASGGPTTSIQSRSATGSAATRAEGRAPARPHPEDAGRSDARPAWPRRTSGRTTISPSVGRRARARAPARGRGRRRGRRRRGRLPRSALAAASRRERRGAARAPPRGARRCAPAHASAGDGPQRGRQCARTQSATSPTTMRYQPNGSSPRALQVLEEARDDRPRDEERHHEPDREVHAAAVRHEDRHAPCTPRRRSPRRAWAARGGTRTPRPWPSRGPRAARRRWCTSTATSPARARRTGRGRWRARASA